MNKVEDWCDSNKFKLNGNKTHLDFFLLKEEISNNVKILRFYRHVLTDKEVIYVF